jgi:hypothetical protein
MPKQQTRVPRSLCNRERFHCILQYQFPVDFELNLKQQTNAPCGSPDVHQAEARALADFQQALTR